MSIHNTWLPNRMVKRCATASTEWLLIASDGTGHESYADMLVAGKVPFPDFDPGCFLAQLSIQNITDPTNSFNVAWHTLTEPTTALYTLIPGNISQITIPGPFGRRCGIWVQKSDSGDTISLTGLF